MKTIGKNAVLSAGLVLLAVGTWAAGHTPPPPPLGTAVVNVESSPYGPVLVVGGGGGLYSPSSPYANAQGYLFPPGSSLYAATIDPNAFIQGLFRLPYLAGCDATTVATSPFFSETATCAGITLSADWPVLTTTGQPIAGPGVNPWLLGSVYRADIGTYQVTYAGEPLYLFDPGPNRFNGERWFETALPLYPWNTNWYLMSPSGQLNPGPADFSVVSPQAGTTYTSNALATTMFPVLGGIPFNVYTFSADNRWGSVCYGACARTFIPVITNGTPTTQAGVNATGVGVMYRFDGSKQVTYNGKPLYTYNQELLLPSNTTAGNGNGVTGFGGHLSLVSP